MNIQKLLRGEINSLTVDEEFEIPCEWYQNTDIVSLKPVKVVGTITFLSEDSILMNITVSLTMILKDSISLEEIPYPFSFQMEENIAERLEKAQNDLDILSILWENIVLEIPMHYTQVKNLEQYQGDGWKLMTEEDYQKKEKNNPFQELLEQMEEE